MGLSQGIETEGAGSFNHVNDQAWISMITQWVPYYAMVSIFLSFDTIVLFSIYATAILYFYTQIQEYLHVNTLVSTRTYFSEYAYLNW